MRLSTTTALLLLGAAFSPVWLAAQDKPTSASPPKAVPIRVENFLLLPEPKAAKSGISLVLGKARFTVFNPVKMEPGTSRLIPYTESEFAKLGISADSFQRKAAEAADRKLASLQPELIKNDKGKVAYAVYRGADPIYACLLTAPSLGKIFEKVFGKEVWVVTPDRNSLYVFPTGAATMEEFAADLEDRFESNPFAASEEVYLLKSDGSELEAVANFTSK
ncbi:MAG: hypothetical protein ACAI34_15635 [Verrucomicrobium sp.]|nr:hypothetical protein [Verrucomicrobium sp.]